MRPKDKKGGGSLVILTLNEIVGIKKYYPQLPLAKVSEFFVVDGGSDDGTVEYLERRGVRVIRQSIPGRGAAFETAIRKARNQHIVFFSPDGNEDPGDITRLFNLLEEGYDMAIASRFRKGSRADDYLDLIPIHTIGNLVFTRLVRLLWGGKITDTINGFRGIKKAAYLRLQPDAPGFSIEFQLSIRALRERMKIAEIPTIEGQRVGRQSGANAIAVGLLLLKVLMSELLRAPGRKHASPYRKSN